MRRTIALLGSASMLLATIGCVDRYESRLNTTVDNLKYQQRLDKFLGKAEQGSFKDKQIFFRPPKPLESAKDQLLGDMAPLFDLSQTFFDPAKADKGVRLTLLARVKQPKKTPKKGQPPPPDTSGRGQFQPDVLTVVGNLEGGADAIGTPSFKDDGHKDNKYKRFLFTNPTNGHSVRIYIYRLKDHEIALLWDIPQALAKGDSTVEPGIPLCLEALRIGAKAQAMFEGAVEDDTAAPRPGAVEGTGAVF